MQHNPEVQAIHSELASIKFKLDKIRAQFRELCDICDSVNDEVRRRHQQQPDQLEKMIESFFHANFNNPNAVMSPPDKIVLPFEISYSDRQMIQDGNHVLNVDPNEQDMNVLKYVYEQAESRLLVRRGCLLRKLDHVIQNENYLSDDHAPVKDRSRPAEQQSDLYDRYCAVREQIESDWPPAAAAHRDPKWEAEYGDLYDDEPAAPPASPEPPRAPKRKNR
ncbi:MAG: hypothetical protein V4490_03115 [Pseudomonadota bacterium]